MGCGRLAIFLCLTSQTAASQTSVPAGPLVRWPEAIGFVVVAATAFGTDGVIRRTIQGQGHNSGFRNGAALVGNVYGNAKYVIPALSLGTVGAKLAGSDDLYGAGRRALKSEILATGTTLLLKSLIGRRRPDISPDHPYRFHPFSLAYNSLPSGHTAVAFALATSLAMETEGSLLDIGLYGLAATTAFARMHVDKHWASDTVVGAAIGILAARLVQRSDRTGDGSAATAVHRGPGVTLRVSFAF